MAMGGGILAQSQAREAQISAVVTRCGCGAPASHLGFACWRPRAVEDRGTVSYWHRNPLKRWWWHCRRKLFGGSL